MKFPVRFVFVLTAAIVAAFLVLAVACGGGEEKATKASPTAAAAQTPKASPTAAETPAVGETPEKTPAGAAGELPAIAAYPGAEEVTGGTYTGTGAFPIPMVGQGELEPGEYGSVQYTIYQTSDSPDKVLDFYKKEFKGWKEEGTYGMEQVGQNGQIAVWSKDDGNVAAWMAAFESEGTTSVVVAVGARQ